MADIQYWDDTLTEECEAIRGMLDRIPSMRDPMEKAGALERVKGRLRSAKGTKRSFKMEIRLVQDVGQRRKYEQRLASLENLLSTLQADVKAMETESQRGELFIAADTGNGFDAIDGNGKMDGEKAGDHMLKEASHLQDKTQDSLANTRNMISQSKEVGVSTLEELERQRGVIENINKETDRMDDNLARAEILLKQFGKRMASDHMIQCFAVINCLLLLGVILYAVLKDGSLTTNNDTAPVSPTRHRKLLQGFFAATYYDNDNNNNEQTGEEESISVVIVTAVTTAATRYLRRA